MDAVNNTVYFELNVQCWLLFLAWGSLGRAHSRRRLRRRMPNLNLRLVQACVGYCTYSAYTTGLYKQRGYTLWSWVLHQSFVY